MAHWPVFVTTTGVLLLLLSTIVSAGYCDPSGKHVGTPALLMTPILIVAVSPTL